MANPKRILCVDCEYDNGRLREIGLVELDLVTLKPARMDSWLVWDDMRKSITPKKKDISLPVWFTNLTGITNEEYQADALPLSNVKNIILKKYGKKAWYAWGDDDRLLGKVFLGPFVNYALVRSHVLNPGENVGIVDQLPLELQLSPHRALQDALMLARLIRIDFEKIKSQRE